MDGVESLAARTNAGYDVGEKGSVWHCRFHPTKAKLACALDGGRVCVFSAPPVLAESDAMKSSFCLWQRDTFWANNVSAVLSLDWNADGTRLAGGCKNGAVAAWSEDGTKLFETRPSYAITCTMCDDGSIVVMRESELDKTLVKGHEGPVKCLRWNRHACHLFATGSDDKRVIVWDCDKRSDLQRIDYHSGWIWDLSWISAKKLVTCADDFTIKIGRLGRSTAVKTFQHHPFQWVYCLRWNNIDDRFASCAHDGSVKIWSLTQKEPVLELRTKGRPVNCIDWHRWPDDGSGAGGRTGSLVASGLDFSVAVWQFGNDLLTAIKPEGKPEGKTKNKIPEPRILSGHSDWIRSVVFRPDGRLLASLDDKGLLMIWSTQSWQVVFQTTTKPFTGFCLDRLSWDPSGSKLAVPNGSLDVVVVQHRDADEESTPPPSRSGSVESLMTAPSSDGQEDADVDGAEEAPSNGVALSAEPGTDECADVVFVVKPRDRPASPAPSPTGSAPFSVESSSESDEWDSDPDRPIVFTIKLK